jgi:hypothetical protein
VTKSEVLEPTNRDAAIAALAAASAGISHTPDGEKGLSNLSLVRPTPVALNHAGGDLSSGGHFLAIQYNAHGTIANIARMNSDTAVISPSTQLLDG